MKNILTVIFVSVVSMVAASLIVEQINQRRQA